MISISTALMDLQLLALATSFCFQQATHGLERRSDHFGPVGLSPLDRAGMHGQ
jgi:hypothetical protein